MAKKMAVPMRDALVETVSSLGTGMKAKMSTFLRSLMQRPGRSSVMKDYDLRRSPSMFIMVLIFYFVIYRYGISLEGFKNLQS